MIKEDMVYIHSGILLIHKEECIWLISNKVDESRAYYTEYSKSEREKQILYIKAYIWNLERWYWWIHLQGSSGDADIANRLLATEEKEKVGRTERVAEKYIHYHM